MESISSQDRRGGPQIYVHVEFGVSWSKKPPKNHEMTYKSRNLRERTPNFPRQVAAPGTNYLAAIHNFEERRSTTTRQPHRVRTDPEGPLHVRRNVGGHHEHQMQEYYYAPPPSYGDSVQPDAHDQARLSRAESRSSHERGRSAPPPLGENPWDVTVSRRQDGNGETWLPPADQWKALPTEPSKFRLGEGGMPWSAWSWPFEYHPDGSSLGEDDASSRSTNAGPSNYPLMVSEVPSGFPALTRLDESGKSRDLGALSAAMMTVDNGFENQWWNQGQRESVLAEDPMGPRSRLSAPGMGAADRYSTASGSIVSPLSANSESPLPHFQSIHRRMSTRSEELFFPQR